MARRWAALGQDVTLQGTVAHKGSRQTVALYTTLTALLCLLGIRWPDQALVCMVLIIWSAIVDLDGGRGWVRSILPTRAAHNVIIWPAKSNGPMLLVAAPMELEVPLRQAPAWVLRIPVGLLFLAAAGTVLMRSHPDIGHPTMLTSAICLGLVSLVAVCWPWLADQKLGGGNPARSALEIAVGQVQRAELTRLRCAFAFIGGSLGHHDGLETLLKNHRHRLRRDSTRVLVLQPDPDTLGVVHNEGRILSSDADPLLVGVLDTLGLAERRRTTAASRARRAGWRAAAMTVGPDQIHAAAAIVTALTQELDEGIVARSEER